MKFQMTFRNVDSSNALRDYAQGVFERQGERLHKESRWQVTFSKTRHECQVQVSIQSAWGHFEAVSTTDDFYESVDRVGDKLEKQILKAKEQLQEHQKPDLVRDRVLDKDPLFYRKVG